MADEKCVCADPEFKEALALVFDLATDNALDNEALGFDEKELLNQYNIQQEAFKVILIFLGQNKI